MTKQVYSGSQRPRLLTPEQLRMLHSSIGNAIRSVVVAQNEFSPISKLPPETLVYITGFVLEPRTRESMFEIVKMTHICQYWRSTLISNPHLWSSIFVKNDHKDFIAACLERSLELPLAVRLDLKYGSYGDYPDCTCIRDNWSSGMRVNVDDPCRYHTTIDPLLDDVHIERIRTLDVNLIMVDDFARSGPNREFKDALDDSGLFAFPVPTLESLSLHVDHRLDIETHLELPLGLFCWALLPPTQLRHLTLHGCYGGPIRAVCNLMSFELAGEVDAMDSIQLDRRTFLPFLSGSPSLVSLSLFHCNFPDRAQPSRVTPVKLPKLKFLRLMGIYELPGFSGLIDVPAFKTLSSLRISVRERVARSYGADILVHAESNDGFKLLYDTPDPDEVPSEWRGVMDDADPTLVFIRFEGRGVKLGGNKENASPLSLFVNAKVLEIGASFAGLRYHDFWKDVEKVGPQLTTLRLEVTEATKPVIAKSVEKLVRERFNKGMPLSKLERMRFEEMSEEAKEKAKELWSEFLAGLNVDQYLVPQ